MKKSIILSTLFIAFGIGSTFAQEKKVVKHEIRKEVQMEEVNGEKTLTIRTSGNGTETIEVYKGEEADKKMAELQAAQGGTEVREEIHVEDVNGQKVVKINKTVDGKTTTEEYQGEEADQKIKDVEKEHPKKANTQEIRRKEIKRIDVKRN